jgi:hypothetical protein
MFNPETQVVGSRTEGSAFVYTVVKDGRTFDVTVPIVELNRAPQGHLGIPERRRILAAVVERAQTHG